MIKTLKYIGKRILFMIPILLGVSLIIFLLSSLIPGTPVDAYINESTTPEQIAKLTEKFGLNEPLPIRYWNWLVSTLQGDLGNSFRSGQPVAEMIGERIGPTLLLAGLALAVSLLISTTLGVLAAWKPYSVIDYVASGMAFLGSGMPAFFLGLISIYLFSVRLGILPNSGCDTNAAAGGFGRYPPAYDTAGSGPGGYVVWFQYPADTQRDVRSFGRRLHFGFQGKGNEKKRYSAEACISKCVDTYRYFCRIDGYYAGWRRYRYRTALRMAGNGDVINDIHQI